MHFLILIVWVAYTACAGAQSLPTGGGNAIPAHPNDFATHSVAARLSAALPAASKQDVRTRDDSDDAQRWLPYGSGYETRMRSGSGSHQGAGRGGGRGGSGRGR
ncbi:hypothetical protein Cenrod_1137 [Candidatus Symbiobacter mobilis CR]|uniref:Secreted protein n=1 Tax=Candidatus Symbiobacter mobilis CR TaxID=946483 RepID=U5N7E3_9BURK|nr:hypothetical protein Cenrod_1137 [Candidatus Symbiobacter mobilis CR]